MVLDSEMMAEGVIDLAEITLIPLGCKNVFPRLLKHLALHT